MRIDVTENATIGRDGIGDVQHVTHLLAVAVDHDWLAAQRADQEMRDPALILGAELAWTVDAAFRSTAVRSPKEWA